MNYRENQSFQWKLTLLTISIGIIYLYFGGLKLFPGLSPAEQIGSTTVCRICFNLISPKLCLLLLALLEIGVGCCLIFRKFLRGAITVAIFHMVMTFTPLLFFPELVFQDTYISPSLLGQYIYKNLVIICALFVVYPMKAKREELKTSY